MRNIKTNYKFKSKINMLSTIIALGLIILGGSKLYNSFFNLAKTETKYINSNNIKYTIAKNEDKGYIYKQQYDNFKWDNYESVDGVNGENIDKEHNLLVKIELGDINLNNPAVYFDGIKGMEFEAYFNGALILKENVNGIQYATDLDRMKRNIIIPLVVQREHDSSANDKSILVLLIHKGDNRYLGPIGTKSDVNKIISMDENESILSNVLRSTTQKVITNSVILAAAIIFIILSLFFEDKDRRVLYSLSIFLILMVIYGVANGDEINLLIYNSSILWNYLFYSSLSLAPIAFVYFFQQVFDECYKFLLDKIRYLLLCASILFISLMLIFTLSHGRVSVMNIEIYGYYGLIGITLLVLVTISFLRAFKGDEEAVIFTMGLLIYIIYIADSVIKKTTIKEGGLILFILSLILLITRRFIRLAQNVKDYSKELQVKNESLQSAWNELSKSKEEISELNRNLEQRVIDRTKELEESNIELKEALDKLRVTQDQLIQSEKMVALGGLVAGVSHEINTPIGVSVTAASYLQEKTKEFYEVFKSNSLKKSDLEKYLNTSAESSEAILSNLQRASELVKSFKQVAVDQSSEIKRRFKIYEYVNQILLSLRPKLKKTKITIGINCDENIEIESFPGAFSQIVTNFVMNSLIHAFEEGQEGTIIFDFEKKDNNIIFTYSDNGKGMDNDIVSKIFDPFFTTKRGKGGTGLGLNIVYNIVTQTLKGTIICESEPALGTIFKITFPIENL
ncbi:sensor histidine kinase [Clostridium sp. YIM B02515]|uniref:histidine kinase n=2 Tax=Clostridium rhizosphaerae TaxID=2803861 RepID=A0ABS1TAB0_9CLOT|nr:sensor histidine kinase [Clostridium rhizosphaerae]